MKRNFDKWKRDTSIILLDVDSKPMSDFGVPDDVLASMFVDELDPIDAAQIILDEAYGDKAPDLGEKYDSKRRISN